MPQSGDFIQMIAKQTLINHSEPLYNIWCFEVAYMGTSTPFQNMIEPLMSWYEEFFSPPIRALQTANLSHIELTFNNFNAYETDFVSATFDPPLDGSLAQNFDNAQSAYSLRLNRLTRVTRHGFKRIGGVPSNAFDNGVLNSAYETPMANLIAMLENIPVVEIALGNQMGLVLAIPKTPIAPATHPSVFNSVTGVTFRGNGSQNSRKQLLPT